MQGFFVLDQNVMQRPALLDFLRQNPQANLVLPDTALVEMSKSEQWEHTFRRNLAPLRAHASRCFMSLSVQEAREIELLQGQSSHDQLLPEEFAQLLRGAIEGSQASEGNDTLAQIRATMPSLRADFEAHDLNAAAAKEELVTRVLEIRSKLTPQEMQACRDPQAGRLAKVIIARNIGDGIYQAYMESAGASIAFARQLKSQQGMCLRWCYMLAHNALSWAVDGGIEPAREKTILNDTLDQDYVIIGSFFSGVISLEAAVTDALTDLRAMLLLPPLPVEYRALTPSAQD
ncbi:MAG TPA: hypothetical protein PK306_02850 [Aquabacterium sp.]|jgi:hypothetical protein|uniref:hypothetical protein n=1 Tax=Hydrogenophaga sp. TaxID=1904254 RepID=UPI002BBA3DC7|nr:hypothetical protein HQS1_46060 [Delftia lacustris]HQC94630.1 hypothetical protein [Aquabacterium sp.]